MAFNSGRSRVKNSAIRSRQKSSENPESKKLWGFPNEFGRKGGNKGGNGRRSRKNVENPRKEAKGGLTMENVTILKRGENIEDVIAAKCSNLMIEDTPENLPKDSSPLTRSISYGDGEWGLKTPKVKSFSRRAKVCPLYYDEQPEKGPHHQPIEPIDERYEFKDVGFDDAETFKGLQDEQNVDIMNSPPKSTIKSSLAFVNHSDGHVPTIEGPGYGNIGIENSSTWVGPTFASSPSPKSLPMPKFSMISEKKVVNSFCDPLEPNSHKIITPERHPDEMPMKCSNSITYITDPFGVDIFGNVRRSLNI
eukprot:TRINITY_DN2666_c0_g1_i1.p1 TRINITY_DN2666_c0_g1~~TRINITY_DN2666_c0_g1_i1.p1  ORF type:complete len:307 (+),score=36.74 TRINITY_DN2666_c0_g1_i1:125-1045(+)